MVSFVPDALWDWRDPRPAWLEFCDRVLRFDVAKLARRVLPAPIAASLRVARDWGVHAGWTHYRQSSRRRRQPAEQSLPSTLRKVLFVCSGNIMRSPLAEALLRRQAPDRPVEIASAGLQAQTGRPADPRMEEAAREHGITLDSHRAQRLTRETVASSDIIFVMDDINEALLLSRFPESAPKLRWLGSFASEGGRRTPIPDPYLGTMADVRACCAQLRRAVEGLAGQLTGHDRNR
jgi:protein-tyrosine phosphatase